HARGRVADELTRASVGPILPWVQEYYEDAPNRQSASSASHTTRPAAMPVRPRRGASYSAIAGHRLGAKGKVHSPVGEPGWEDVAQLAIDWAREPIALGLA